MQVVNSQHDNCAKQACVLNPASKPAVGIEGMRYMHIGGYCKDKTRFSNCTSLGSTEQRLIFHIKTERFVYEHSSASRQLNDRFMVILTACTYEQAERKRHTRVITITIPATTRAWLLNLRSEQSQPTQTVGLCIELNPLKRRSVLPTIR